MYALVLSGGTNKGCYEAGAIEVVFNKGFVPDGLYGISVGSLNALFLADRAGRVLLAGKNPDWPAIGSELVAFWQQKITAPSSFIKERGKLAILWAILTKKFNGLTDTSPLRALIESSFAIPNVDAWRTRGKFSMGVTNVWSALFSNIEQSTPDLFGYAMGSSALPLFMPASVVNGVPYFDGSLRSIAPFKKPIADGADYIIAAVCQPHDIDQTNIAYQDAVTLAGRSIDIVMSQIINDDIDMAQKINSSLALSQAAGFVPMEGHILHGKRIVDLKVIRPDTDLPIALTSFGPADIQKLIDLGRAKAMSVLA